MAGITPFVGAMDSERKIPLYLTIGVHVSVFLAAMITPLIINKQPRLPEVYTVNLFSASEIGPAPAPQKPAPKKTEPPVPAKVEPPKAEVSVPPVPEVSTTPSVPAQKPRVVSLKPSKTKKMKKKAPNTVDLTKALNRIQARVEEKQAKATADKAVHSAVQQLRNSLHTSNTRITGSGKTAGGKTGESTTEMDEIQKRYFAAVVERIHAFWNLPDLQNWEDSLVATVVLEVRKDGIVTSKFFLNKSDNLFFNQFVEKAIQEASPLPPFPLGLNEKHLEIGLRFSPGELL